MDASSDPATSTPTHRWKDWLGLNTSTLALLGTILLVTAATELWAPLIPQYLKALRTRAGSGEELVKIGETILIRISQGAVVTCGIVRVEIVGDFPRIAQEIVIRVRP